jgi:hypothetical protein
MSTLYKGYYIHTRSASEVVGKLHGPYYAPDGSLPDEWTSIQQDEDVTEAQLFSSTQRYIRGDKRRILEHFDRNGSEGAA